VYSIVKSNNFYCSSLVKGAGTPYRRVPLQKALHLYKLCISSNNLKIMNF